MISTSFLLRALRRILTEVFSSRLLLAILGSYRQSQCTGVKLKILLAAIPYELLDHADAKGPSGMVQPLEQTVPVYAHLDELYLRGIVGGRTFLLSSTGCQRS